MNLVLVRAGIRTADVLLAQFYGLAPVEKAGPDPLTPRGFDRVVLGVLRELRAGVAGKEKKAIEALLRELEGKDWAKLGEAARDKAFNAAAQKYLGFGPEVGAAVGQVARHVGPTIIAGTKAAAVGRDRLRIEPSLNAVDERMVVAAATHQALFARDEHGRRSAYLSDRARAAVSQGLEEGLDRYDIAKLIRKDVGAAADVRSENYWRLIASVFTGRARTYGHLSAMGEAGVDEFEFEAVLDEVTTEICRFMHGKTFSVGGGLSKFAEVEQARDPEEVKNIQPWAGTGKTSDGGLALFYKTDAGRHMIAQVDEPAVGKKDTVGKYSKTVDNKTLEKAGCTTPPLHGHCRSTTLPVLGAVQVLPGGPGQEALGAPLTPEEKPAATSAPQQGVHFAELFAKGVSTKDAAFYISGVSQPAALEALAAYPMRVVTVRDRAPALPESTAGRYLPAGKSLVVQTKATVTSGLGEGVYGSMVPDGSGKPGQRPFGVPNLAKDKREFVRRVVTHEIGHHVHGCDETHPTYDKKVDDVVVAAFKVRKSATQYGDQDRQEYFAECFAAYNHIPDELKDKDPTGYAMVEDVLTLRGAQGTSLHSAQKTLDEDVELAIRGEIAKSSIRAVDDAF